MPIHLPVTISANAVGELVAYCRSHEIERFALVADQNTYAALGEAVEAALLQEGRDVRQILLKGEDIGADALSVYQVMLGLDRSPRTYLAVGSGTITDVVRFVSHRSNAKFISLPTAPSVDGFTSVGAPMIVDGIKVTVECHGPLAVFADLPTLCAAPRPLIAAGFGDLIAKLTSGADWELGALLWDEPFDAAIAERGRAAVYRCVERIKEVAEGACDGIEALMAGLIETGFCMLDFGQTRPASGHEHHASHYWEMKLLREGRHSLLHGAKVGLGVLASTRLYDRLRECTLPEAKSRLAGAELPARRTEIDRIVAAYGPLADQAIRAQARWLEMSVSDHAALKARVLDCWDDVQRIARAVPPTAEMESWLRRVGGPTTPAELGLSAEEYAEGLASAHYQRDRFTIKKLALLLGL